MNRILKAATAAALLAGGATFAIAQTSTTAPPGAPAASKVEPGAPTQGSDPKASPSAVGSRPIGPPADTATPAPANNPTGVSKEKQKSEANDPQAGGKKN
jgi:hypothetical protein